MKNHSKSLKTASGRKEPFRYRDFRDIKDFQRFYASIYLLNALKACFLLESNKLHSAEEIKEPEAGQEEY